MEKVFSKFSNYMTILSVCEDALKNHKMIGISGNPGLGKTTSLLAYKQQRQENVIYLKVEKSMTPKLFYLSILKNCSDEHIKPSKPIKFNKEKLVEIFNRSGENKLLIIDEVGKLTPKMIGYLNEIREITRQNVGIVLADIEYFKKNIERWKKMDKSEIIKFDNNIDHWYELSPPSEEDIQAIINSNSKN